MRQYFKVVLLDNTFETIMNKLCSEFWVLKWEIARSNHISNKEMIIIHYRDRWIDEGSQLHDSVM